MIFIKCLCIFINLSDLHLCDIDNLAVSHVLPEQSGHCLHAHPDPRLPYRLRPSGHSHFRLNNAAWRAACEAGVALHRPNRRGCRGGTRKQRPIHVIVSTRPTVALFDTNCVKYDNITSVSVTPSPSMDHSEPGVDVSFAINKSASSRVAVPVKLGIVNARSI